MLNDDIALRQLFLRYGLDPGFKIMRLVAILACANHDERGILE